MKRLKRLLIGSLLTCLLAAGTAPYAGKAGCLESGEKLKTRVDDAIGLMDDTAETALSDIEELELPEPLAERAESTLTPSPSPSQVEGSCSLSSLGEGWGEGRTEQPWVGSKVILSPVAKQWGATGWENSSGTQVQDHKSRFLGAGRPLLRDG